MNGACHTPLVSRTCGTVGGALRSAGNDASTECDDTNGASTPAIETVTTSARPNVRLITGARIHEAERNVGQQRAEREEDGAGAGTAGHEIDVARAQRVEHQAAEAWPCRDDLHRERSAQQCADDETVHRGHRTQ